MLAGASITALAGAFTVSLSLSPLTDCARIRTARENAPTLTGDRNYDANDPLTTNLHVGGLPQNATEESLGKLFAQYGGVGSVKVRSPLFSFLPLS